MKLSYKPDEVDKFYHYYYEWIDYLDAVMDPKNIIKEYLNFEDPLKSKFISVGWDEKNVIGVIWIPPFAVGSIVLGGEDSFLEKYSSKVFDDCKLSPNAWTRGIILFHVKNVEDGTSIILSPIELDIPNYGL